MKRELDSVRLSYLAMAIASVAIAAGTDAALFWIADRPSTITNTVGRIALHSLFIYVLFRFFQESFRSFRPATKDLVTLTATIVLQAVLIAVGRLLTLGIVSYFQHARTPITLESDLLLYSIPFATIALILQSILGFSSALFGALCIAILTINYFSGGALLAIYIIVAHCIAALSVQRFRRRSAFLKASMRIAAANLVVGFCFLLIMPRPSAVEAIIIVAAAFMSGVLCAFIATALLPLLETLGGYVTDLRLIEMATLDHPLLKELSIQCPGTWNHSMVMGMMSEAAAESINANPVVARVGAYFHDIGKTTKPLYFVENQLQGENRHDKLSSSMSALIIRSHVKDGIELAKKHHLPDAIIDMIPQHHGTSCIEFFYDKARKEAEEAGEDPELVDRTLYSYPGPKPQTKEAGILMLADGIEAAARTIAEPSLDRIQGMVQKMINKVFSSGELDECELTLKDLHHIAKCFTRVLSGIYHQRISYAEPAEKVSAEKSSEETSSVDNRGQYPDNEKNPDDKSNREGQSEDLKRLGL